MNCSANFPVNLVPNADAVVHVHRDRAFARLKNMAIISVTLLAHIKMESLLNFAITCELIRPTIDNYSLVRIIC